ncbi:MAG TPA: hypothetical protein VJB35_06960 [Candidatus Nanoarchaeia archaeon]|nr:hypothetical protein [Candidatus Nanoarchaeia archaeon]
METTIYTLALLACTGLFFGFFCWNSKAKERLEAIQNGTVTSKYENFFGHYIKVNNIQFRVSPKAYSELAVGTTFPLQQ